VRDRVDLDECTRAEKEDRFEAVLGRLREVGVAGLKISLDISTSFVHREGDAAGRKVEAACQFLPGILPANPKVCAIRFDPEPPDELPLCMEMHWQFLRGAGNHESLARQGEDELVSRAWSLSVEDCEEGHGRSIPTVDLIGDIDEMILPSLTHGEHQPR
jgi:hypothetical protein